MHTLSILARWSLSALAVATAALAPVAAPLAAQQPAKVQLAFGYHCDNTFALRNEGTQTANVDWVVLGTADEGRIIVKPTETVQIESATEGDVELYVDGRLVATEHKGNRSCAALTGAPSGTVTVRHLDAAEVVVVQPQYVQPVYQAPLEIVDVRPYYYPRSSFSLSVGFPFFSSPYYGGYYRGYYGGSHGRVVISNRGRGGGGVVVVGGRGGSRSGRRR